MIRYVALCWLAMNLRAATTIEYIDQMTSTMQQQHVFISKVEPKKSQNSSWSCDCYNSTEGMELVLECRCQGKELKEVPPDLDENLYRITVTDSDIKFIRRSSFQPYRKSLRDIWKRKIHVMNTIRRKFENDEDPWIEFNKWKSREQKSRNDQEIQLEQEHELNRREKQDKSSTEFVDSSTSWKPNENEESDSTSEYQSRKSKEIPYITPIRNELSDMQGDIYNPLENPVINVGCETESPASTSNEINTDTSRKVTILQNITLHSITEAEHQNKETTTVPGKKNLNIQNIRSFSSLRENRNSPDKIALYIILGNLPLLRVVEEGTFRNIPNLRTLYISQAPQMKFLNGLFMGATAMKFRSLRIVQTGLQEIPDLSYLHTENIVHMIELDGNKIQKIRSNSVKIKAEQVTLNYNEITVVENLAFNGSQIGTLSMRGNEQLTQLQPKAFQGLSSLRQLDLSWTAIETLPVEGLSEIEILRIENTPSMKTIPSIYELQNLKEADLTHPFHCCAFKYPEQHDPKGYAHYQEKVRKACEGAIPVLDTGQTIKSTIRKKRSHNRIDYWADSFDHAGYVDIGYESHPRVPGEPLDWTPNLEHNKGHPSKTDHSHLNPLRGKTIEHQEAVETPEEEDFGTFHQTSAEILENKPVNAFCGNITINTRLIKCYPEPNALNPCEDIMGSYWLRISVWFVVVLAVMGNLAVIVVVLFSGGEVTVQRFLICNLAFADFCMGLYLLFIASMDLHSVGTYFNYAFDWQFGVGCQVAGFLTVFASQLSIFTLTVVTMERWFAITHAMHLTRRIRLGAASKIMLLGWLYSILMASLPLFGVSNYSSTSICLPMEVNQIADKAYLIAIIVINGIAFALIVFCYAQIYFSLGYETRHCSTNGEMTIAKKMALLVFTDFACWAPIAFFALTALAGYPLIGVTRSKILLVFFYPLNSCANPYLYAIMTAQYRRDFFVLLSRCGLCTKAAQQYTVTTSLPTANNSHPIPLLVKSTSNGRKLSNRPNNNVDDAFV